METSAEWVLVAIAYVAFGDVRDVFDDQGLLKAPSEWDERTAASVGLEIGTSAKGQGGGGACGEDQAGGPVAGAGYAGAASLAP